MSSQLPTALGLGIRELAQAVVPVMSASGTVVLAAVAATGPLAVAPPPPRDGLGRTVVTGPGGPASAARRGPGTVRGRILTVSSRTGAPS